MFTISRFSVRSAHAISLPSVLRSNRVHFARSFSTVPAIVRTVVLPDAVKKELTTRLSAINLSSNIHLREMTSKIEEVLRQVMPRDVQEVLGDMGTMRNPQALLIKNCPVKNNPGPTSDGDRHSLEEASLEELFALGMAGLRYSKPCCFRGGILFKQIRTMKGFEDEPSSRGSGKYFPFHTEQINKFPGIEFLTLFCKKGDRNAATEILSIDEILKRMPDWMIQGMQKPIFAMKPGKAVMGPEIPTFTPILQKEDGGFNIRFNADIENRIEGATEEANVVLQYLKDYFSKKEFNVESVVLERGDCLTLNNKKLMHGRSAYSPSTSWSDRRDLIGLCEMADHPRIFRTLFPKKFLKP